MNRTLSLTFFLSAFLISSAHAVDPGRLPMPVTPKVDPSILRAPQIKPSQVDLTINGIYGNRCKSDLSDVDLIYMGGVNVMVGKRDAHLTPTEPGAAVGTLRVTYQDVRGTVHDRSFPLNNSSFGATGEAWVEVTREAVMLIASHGIIAEVSLDPGYASRDSNPDNNRKISRACEIFLR